MIGAEDSIGEIGILAPFPTESGLLPPDDFEDETGNARYVWEVEGQDQEALDIDPEHILAWGYTSEADILCWLTSDPDPDKWPVLLFDRQELLVPCTIVPCGMVEFLRKVLLHELDSYSIDFKPEPRFTYWREQR